jgi:hypothetical protein
MTQPTEDDDGDLVTVIQDADCVIDKVIVWRNGCPEIMFREKSIKDGLRGTAIIPRLDREAVRDLDPDIDELVITIKRRKRPPHPHPVR